MKRDIQVIALYLAILSVVSMLVSTVPLEFLWGMGWSRFIPVSGRVTFVALALIGFLPPVRRSIADAMTTLEQRITGRVSTALELVMIAAAAFLFYHFTADNPLLGDTYSILTRGSEGKDIMGFSWLNVLLHESLAEQFGGDPGSATRKAYQLTSIVAGIIVLLAARYFTKNFAQFFVVLLVIGTFGMMQLYFGYIERYPTTYALMFVFLVSAQRDIDRNKLSPVTPIVLLVAIGFHLASGVLLPAYLVSVYLIRRSRSSVIAGVLIALIVAIMAYLVVSRQGEAGDAFLPLFAEPGKPYAFFTLQHFLDLVNVVLLSYPLLLILAVSNTVRRLPQRWFLLTALTPALGFVLLVDPKLGAMRDWDLLSLAAPVVVCMALVVMRSFFAEKSRLGYWLLLPALAFALLHTGAWVYGNTKRVASYEYMKPYIRNDLHYSPEAESGNLNVRYAEIVHEFYGDKEEGIQAQWRLLKGKPDNSVARYSLAVNLANLGRYDTADSLISDHWEEFRFHPEVFRNLTKIFREAENWKELDAVLSKALTLDPRNKLLYEHLSNVKEHRGQRDSAFVYGLEGAKLDARVSPSKLERLIKLARMVGFDREADSLSAVLNLKR